MKLKQALLIIFLPAAAALAVDTGLKISNSPVEMHGFYELRAGYRLRNDKHEKDMSIMENRFQLDFGSYPEWGELRFKGDAVGDLVLERFDFKTREAYIFTRPSDNMDLIVGRQILTWGTGDLVFINDLFPKDWQSFFIGRDDEYLKAPSDAAKLSMFGDFANLDVVFTPRFDPDIFVSGQRISYWNQNTLRIEGKNIETSVDKPDRWFRDYELAARLYKNVNEYEYALYAYRGFWKIPAGQNADGKAIFPDLNVYGASVRGKVAKGIGNLELGYYESADDQSGKKSSVDNSQMRYLAGYKQEIGKDLTLGLQYYIEQILSYQDYLDNLPKGPAKDEFRHLVTVRLTKLLMNQNLRLNLFAYYSPSDKDCYFRPSINYKATDNIALEAGANIFFGDYPNTFFGQFTDNTNIYTSVRYSF
ncbi:MAG: hypothetical protein WC496_04405 [Phycisphaerae bacterium]